MGGKTELLAVGNCQYFEVPANFPDGLEAALPRALARLQQERDAVEKEAAIEIALTLSTNLGPPGRVRPKQISEFSWYLERELRSPDVFDGLDDIQAYLKGRLVVFSYASSSIVSAQNHLRMVGSGVVSPGEKYETSERFLEEVSGIPARELGAELLAPLVPLLPEGTLPGRFGGDEEDEEEEIPNGSYLADYLFSAALISPNAFLEAAEEISAVAGKLPKKELLGYARFMRGIETFSKLLEASNLNNHPKRFPARILESAKRIFQDSLDYWPQASETYDLLK
ncbi:MAG: hypothetical protein V1820_03940 [archaeon]